MTLREWEIIHTLGHRETIWSKELNDEEGAEEEHVEHDPEVVPSPIEIESEVVQTQVEEPPAKKAKQDEKTSAEKEAFELELESQIE